jgi:hypothetical protein
MVNNNKNHTTTQIHEIKTEMTGFPDFPSSMVAGINNDPRSLSCASRFRTREAPIMLLIEEKKVATKMPTIISPGTTLISTIT